MMQAFKLSKPVSSDILQQGVPKQTHQLGFQMPETTGMFLIQTIVAAASMRAPKLPWKRGTTRTRPFPQHSLCNENQRNVKLKGPFRIITRKQLTGAVLETDFILWK